MMLMIALVYYRNDISIYMKDLLECWHTLLLSSLDVRLIITYIHILDEVGDGGLTNYRPEAPAAEEDSQMSFNADEFFQTNFQIGGDGGDEPQPHGENGVMMEYETVEGEVMADGDVYVNNTPVPQPGDVVNNDLQLSESDEDLDEQPEGVGFDFDEFDA